MHGGFIPEGEANFFAEVVAQVIGHFLIGEGDEGIHGRFVKVIDKAAFLGGRADRGIEVERHDFEIAFGHLSDDRLARLAAGTDLGHFEGLAVHHHGANVEVVRDGELGFGGAGDVLLDHLQALGDVLRVLRIELAINHAGGIGPLVVEDHAHAAFARFFEGEAVKLKVLFAEIDNALRRGSAPRSFEVIIGQAGGGSAAGLGSEAAHILPGHVFDRRRDALARKSGEIEEPVSKHLLAAEFRRWGFENGGIRGSG